MFAELGLLPGNSSAQPVGPIRQNPGVREMTS